MSNVATGRQPKSIGQIHFDDFSSNTITDYQLSLLTGTAFISAGDMLIASGNGSWISNTISFNKPGSSHLKTCLSSWTQRIKFRCTSSPTATTWGLPIGVFSSNPYQQRSVWAWFRMDSAFSSRGKMHIIAVLGASITILHTSSLNVRVQDNDEYDITITAQDNTINYSVLNITTTGNYSGLYNFVYSAGASVLHNTGKFALNVLGGTQSLHEWTISSNELIKDNNVIFVGDECIYGCFCGFSFQRWPLVAMLGSFNVYALNAGTDDITQSIVDRLPELLVLNPIYIVLMIGGNDILNAVSTPTWQANYTNIVNTLKAASMKIVHCFPTPRNAVDVTPINTFINANFTLDTIVDTYTPLKAAVGTGLHATYDSGNGKDPNTAGHDLIASTVIGGAPFLYTF